MSDSKSFTGRTRDRTTKRSVKVQDAVARGVISVGGVATIAAVLAVMLFLVWVVVPLFLPAEISDVRTFDRAWTDPPVHVGVDEYRLLAWTLEPNGRVEVFRLDSGATRAEHDLAAEGELSAWAFEHAGETAVLGYADGTIRIAELGFESEVVAADRLPSALRTRFESEPPGAVFDWPDGALQRIPTGQARAQKLAVRIDEPIRLGSGPVRQVAFAEAASGPIVLAVVERSGAPPDEPLAEEVADEGAEEVADKAEGVADEAVDGADGTPALVAVYGRTTSNFLTGETTLRFDPPVELPYRALGGGDPTFLGVSGTGAEIYVAWDDGSFLRIETPRQGEPSIAEHGRLVESGLSALRFVLGNNTLVWARDDGSLAAGFPIRIADFDGAGISGLERSSTTASMLVQAKDLVRPGGSAITAIAPSTRSRLVLTGAEDGEIRLFNVTNEAQLVRTSLPERAPILALAMAPKEDALVAVSTGKVHVATLDPRYSEASFNALFRESWYEGYAEPIHSWQSSSGTDDFEPKHSLMPLIFGTLKATFYSMLFGAPLALLAAIYTSEFLHPRARATIKPTIELMASLPSVVLGFLAALVIAPFVEDVVPATLALFVTLPLAFLLGAQAWQLLPVEIAVRLERWRFAAMALVLPFGVAAAAWLGPVFEGWLFAGDLKAWLAWNPSLAEAQPGMASAVGGWMFLTLPLAACVTAFFFSRVVNGWLRLRGSDWDRRRFALADLAKLLTGVLVTAVTAFVLASVLDAIGLDPRGGFVDTYVQRNALVVGFVMGFAIIPIIYTISEDALSAVPEHLRSASLGAGATPWQTAIRIVLPTAMSGLFSALMIGLGRAVGETMIVLMAAGNTPVMEWNIFEGFRTLSANIAVELPEAVQGSTHYRILFLAALVLFVMTFIVNTVAEIVRLRFRKRAYQL